MRARGIWLLTVVVAVAFCGDCSSPSGPSATNTPPVSRVGDPPAVTCPANISFTAPATGPALVNYDLPATTAGEGAVNVACTPEPGAEFPIGTSSVECIATDALKRTATCSFSVFVAPSPIPPKLRLNRIMAFGDSITVGEIITPNTDNLLLTVTPSAAYPTILAQLLKERYGDQPAVFNAGLSGEKAVNADRRFAPTLGAFSPEVVVLLEGSNDLLYAEPAAGVESAIQGLGVIAAEARNRRLRVFLCTLPPTKPGRRNIPLGIVQAANDRIRGLARSEGAAVIDLFTPLLQDLDVNIGPDGLHPTATGYRRIAETVFEALRADLEIR